MATERLLCTGSARPREHRGPRFWVAARDASTGCYTQLEITAAADDVLHAANWTQIKIRQAGPSSASPGAQWGLQGPEHPRRGEGSRRGQRGRWGPHHAGLSSLAKLPRRVCLQATGDGELGTVSFPFGFPKSSPCCPVKEGAAGPGPDT